MLARVGQEGLDSAGATARSPPRAGYLPKSRGAPTSTFTPRSLVRSQFAQDKLFTRSGAPSPWVSCKFYFFQLTAIFVLKVLEFDFLVLEFVLFVLEI
jgi:hypothetical protein